GRLAICRFGVHTCTWSLAPERKETSSRGVSREAQPRALSPWRGLAGSTAARRGRGRSSPWSRSGFGDEDVRAVAVAELAGVVAGASATSADSSDSTARCYQVKGGGRLPREP